MSVFARWFKNFGYSIILGLAAVAGAAPAADHLYVNTRNNSEFRAVIGNFLNSKKPDLSDIHCTLAGGVVFHVWLKPGSSNNIYSLNYFPTKGNANWITDVSNAIDSQTSVPCAFNADDGLWMVDAKKVN